MTCTDHPAVKVRDAALRRLARQFPSRCEADREDAVHEALCAALRVGKAGNRRVVCGWAARRLLGTDRRRGVIVSSRSAATSIAGPALSLPRTHDQGECAVAPSEWLDSVARVARVVDIDAVLDAFAAERRRREEAAAAERRRRELAEDMRRRAEEARLLVPAAAAACGSMRALAAAMGVSVGAPYRWRNPRDFSPPGADLMVQLRTLARAPGARP